MAKKCSSGKKACKCTGERKLAPFAAELMEIKPNKYMFVHGELSCPDGTVIKGSVLLQIEQEIKTPEEYLLMKKSFFQAMCNNLKESLTFLPNSCVVVNWRRLE